MSKQEQSNQKQFNKQNQLEEQNKQENLFNDKPLKVRDFFYIGIGYALAKYNCTYKMSNIFCEHNFNDGVKYIKNRLKSNTKIVVFLGNI